MSEFDPAAGVPQAAGDGATAGQLLMQARQAAGMHVAALAMTLKVPVDKLEALEADRYEMFNDVVFMRALAASACRVLKRDSAPVLALLPGGALAPLRIDKGINASFKDTTHRGASFSGSARETPRPRLLIAVVAVLLAGALAIVLWPQGLTPQSLLARFSAAEAPAADAPPAQAAAPTQSPAPAASAAAEPLPILAASAPAAAPAAPAAGPATPAANVVAPSTAAAAPAGDAALVLHARAPSWVQVRSGGALVLQKTLVAGESVAVPGAAPWSVVIGRADATEVIVRGVPLDLAARTRDNVARFEVN